MSNDNNILFKALNDSEKKSKLYQLTNGKSSNVVTIWKKGQTTKYNLKVTDFIRAKTEIYIKGNIPQEFTGDTLLLTFEINGMHFFGKCKLVIREGMPASLDCSADLYKSERRNNFRLLTYPHHEVYVSINVGVEKIKKSNILSLNTGQSQTSLFKNFLNIMDDIEENSVEELEGYLRFRVTDISVTGLAFQFGKIESQFFTELNKELGIIFVDFNGDLIKIPNAKVLYVIDKAVTNSKATLYKGGTQFLDVDVNLDEILSKRINETLRSSEAEFEDFIK